MERRTFLGVAGPALTGTVAATLIPHDTVEAASPSAAARAATEKNVLRLERQWMNAIVQRDAETLESLTAPDFRRVGKVSPNYSMPRAQWLGNALRWYRIEAFRFLSSSVRFSEQAAVVTTRYRWRGALGEVPINEMVTAEDTWEERNGRWLVVSQLVSPPEKLGRKEQPARPRKTIQIDPALYRAFVGQYEFGPSRKLTITHEEGRLMHEGSGGQRAELFPETKTRFFRTDKSVLTLFVKKRGQVTHVIHRHANGRESVGKRIA